MNQSKKVQRLIKRAKKHVYTVNHSLAQKGVSRATCAWMQLCASAD
jgi:hypothetical protein